MNSSDRGAESLEVRIADIRLLEDSGVVIPPDIGVAGTTAAPDDVLDAAIAAWSANRHARGESVPLVPAIRDASGRTVTIKY